ncbi:MAG TPA: hypothetical protein VF704_00275 [Allosphingosinicella sp.]|jgi:zinc transporter ZupT
MPDPISWGHVLMLLGVVLLAAAGAMLIGAMRWNGPEHGRGTPGYARARSGRRSALYAAVAGILLLAAGCFTPLAEMPLG